MNSSHKDGRQRLIGGGEANICLKARSVYPQVFKNENPEFPFYLIMTYLTFVFNLPKIIIFTKDHV